MTRMPTGVVAFVFARGGSKGLPRKNLQPLAGRPLVAHAIAHGLACPLIERVVVSTDDDDIARVAEAAGALVPFRRPAELASDTAPEWLAWRHAVVTYEELFGTGSIDTFVCLPATAPLRRGED